MTGNVSRTNLIARALWVSTLLLALAGLLMSIPNRNTSVPVSWGELEGLRILSVLFLTLLFIPALVTVGLLIARRQPYNAIGWLFLGAAFLVALEQLLNEYTIFTFLTRGNPPPFAAYIALISNTLWVWYAIGLLVYSVLLFPDGRLPSLRWRWVAWLVIASLFSMSLVISIIPGPFENVTFVDNPIVIPALISLSEILAILIVGPLMITTAIALAALIHRFRHASTAVRQQIKWLLVAASLEILFLGASSVIGKIGELIVVVGLLMLPAAFGVAILRYRLYDIDLLINRSLVYGLLTGLLALLYFGGVLLFQTLFRALTGQESQLAIVLSTLAIAALFTPLRSRLQDFIDRRFYRRKYDAEQTLTAFNSAVRDEVDVEQLSEKIATVVNDTMQPAHISLWLTGLDSEASTDSYG